MTWQRLEGGCLHGLQITASESQMGLEEPACPPLNVLSQQNEEPEGGNKCPPECLPPLLRSSQRALQGQEGSFRLPGASSFLPPSDQRRVGGLAPEVHRTVSRMTPMRLWGRSASARGGLLLARGLPAGTKVLRSPQLRRCRKPGCLREGGTWARAVLGCNGAIILGRIRGWGRR